MRKIVFDIETKNIFQEVGSSDPASLDISVVALHDSLDDTYHSFFEEQFDKMWSIFEKADMLIGFNSDHFDIPILAKYAPFDIKKIRSLDILKEVKNSLGRRIKLDTLAEATLGRNKSGHGLEAIRWWREGKKDKVAKYCIEDVRITKEIYDYARANKHLKYKDGGTVKDIALNPSAWEEETLKTISGSLF